MRNIFGDNNFITQESCIQKQYVKLTRVTFHSEFTNAFNFSPRKGVFNVLEMFAAFTMQRGALTPGTL